jgi:hypothetical protein
MKIWHYIEAGGSQGQADEENLNELVAVGTIRRETNMWSEGMAEWQAAS